MSNHFGTSWNTVKVNIPGIGERAYIYANYTNVGGQCLPNPLNLARQCMYIKTGGNNGVYLPGNIFDGLFPVVGEYVTVNQTNNAGTNFSTACYKVLEIVDEATFNTGTCVSCYNNGYAGNCSDAFVTVPPYPGDPNGCLYTNTINPSGIATTSYPTNQSNVTAFINTDCVSCTSGTPPPPPTPLNFVQNCCDPSEQYQFSPTSSIAQYINSVSSQSGVIVSNLNAFMADLYIGGAQTGMKCWSVGTNLSPQLIPFVYSVAQTGMVQNGVMVVFPNCQQLQNYIQLHPNMPPCCGPPPTEYCCLTGVAGPAGPTTCTQVALGTCSPLVISNYSAGPFQSQQLCLAAGCATVSDPPYECELPVAALINLQAKVKGFSDRRTQALNEPKSDPAIESAFKNTGTSTISPGTKIKSDSSGGGNADTRGNQAQSRGGGERPAPSNPYVGG